MAGPPRAASGAHICHWCGASIRDWVSVLFALPSAGAGFLAVVAFIIYAANQGALE